MALNINQFAQSVVKGMPDLQFNINTLACRVFASEAVALIPGQAVKRVDSGGPGTLPVVTAVTDDADDIFGFVNYNIKNTDFAAGEAVEISSFQANVMYMEASAAIAVQAQVAVTVLGSTVRTAVSTDRIVGRALDKANAAGDLIRVYINLPGAIA